MSEDFEATLARWQAEEAQRKAGAKVNLRAVIEQLRSLGVTSVNVEYDGSGDEGQIENIAFEPEGLSIPRAVEQQMEDACDELCPDGYQDNDGGFGSISIDVATGRVEHEHNDRYTEVNTTQEAYDV